MVGGNGRTLCRMEFNSGIRCAWPLGALLRRSYELTCPRLFLPIGMRIETLFWYLTLEGSRGIRTPEDGGTDSSSSGHRGFLDQTPKVAVYTFPFEVDRFQGRPRACLLNLPWGPIGTRVKRSVWKLHSLCSENIGGCNRRR
jgi:hypothetical protein